MTVAQLLAEGPAAAARGLWGPLCLAALNTPVERASAQVFANVLRAAFTSRRASERFRVRVRRPVGAVSGCRAALRRSARRTRRAAHASAVARRRSTAASRSTTEARSERFDSADRRRRSASARRRRCRAHPAFAQTLRRRASARLRADRDRLARLCDANAACRGRSRRSTTRPGNGSSIGPTCCRARGDDASRPAARPARGRRHQRERPARRVDAGGACRGVRCAAAPARARAGRRSPGRKTIVEQRATYACTPDRPLPATALPHPRVALAGDWIDAEFPATIEAAVRTGVAAAMALDRAGTRARLGVDAATVLAQRTVSVHSQTGWSLAPSVQSQRPKRLALVHQKPREHHRCGPPTRRRRAGPAARSGRSTRAPCPSSSRAHRKAAVAVSAACCSASATTTFAIETSLRAKSPASSLRAARIVSSRPISICIAAEPSSALTLSRSASRRAAAFAHRDVVERDRQRALARARASACSASGAPGRAGSASP